MKKCPHCGSDNTDEAVNCSACGKDINFSRRDEDDLHAELKAITLRLFANHEAAGIAAANLEAHGIKCWVSADDCGGAYPNLTAAGGVRLRVLAVEAEAASALLDTPLSPAEIAILEKIKSSESAPTKTDSWRPAYVQILAGIILGVLLTLFYQGTKKGGTHIYYQYGRDGRADEKTVYKNGYLIEHFRDRNHDGIWDYWGWHDGHGHVSKVIEDNNFDGKPDTTCVYSNDVVVSLEKDTDFNGIPDEIYTYSNSLPCQLDIKPNGSSYVTLREIYKNAVLTEQWRGGDSNGNFKEVVRYDPFGNPIGTNAFNYLPAAP